MSTSENAQRTSTERVYRCDRWVWEHRWEDDYYGVKCADCGQFYAYGCEPWAPDSDDRCELDDDYDEEPDEYEEALGNCHAFIDGGFMVCMAVGSEDCDECPFNSDLGKSEDQLQEECGNVE
jgi:hypothetical protein